ncbi:hypothetical protein [Marinobacter zhejiangensis]|uniref:Uncharacterized protein n=1 Tax=Marinobacter zhejiangensis TaxID=488535 RepID=A0A1I4P4G9_9GAMM|nr:hypothetical protein [Marinobacter zhejiangensis]SFM22440.1 hypothetical protein SAMN04487963_1793 [Marinobacter zhejiangensis]
MMKVIVDKPRPDFRVFFDLLFGQGRNVDSEGDAYPVFSREWRDLYFKDREGDEPKVEIYAEIGNPLEFEVESKSVRLEELSALYLFLFCGDSISKGGIDLGVDAVNQLKIKYSGELLRAENSIWHNSNENNPYPNIA